MYEAERKKSLNFTKPFERKRSSSSLYNNGSKKYSYASINKGDKFQQNEKTEENKNVTKKDKLKIQPK